MRALNMGRIYKWLGSKDQARQLWENRESLDRYLKRLKELMEDDNCVPSPDSDNAELQAKKLSNEDASGQVQSRFHD